MRSTTFLLLSLLIPSLAFAKLETPQPIVSEDVHRALARAEQVIELVRATRNVTVADYPDDPWPSDLRVSLVVLNNGIEFAATYFVMLLALFFLGGGRFVSVDYWMARSFRQPKA